MSMLLPMPFGSEGVPLVVVVVWVVVVVLLVVGVLAVTGAAAVALAALAGSLGRPPSDSIIKSISDR